MDWKIVSSLLRCRGVGWKQAQSTMRGDNCLERHSIAPRVRMSRYSANVGPIATIMSMFAKDAFEFVREVVRSIDTSDVFI